MIGSVKLLTLILSYISQTQQATFVVFDNQVQSPNYCFSSDWTVTDVNSNAVLQGQCNPGTCGTLGSFMGPMSVTLQFEKIYTNLPVHTQYQISYSLLKVDNIDQESINMDIDSISLFSISYNLQGIHSAVQGYQIVNETNGGQTQCKYGSVLGDDVSISLVGQATHTASTLDVKIYTNFIQTDGGWGIRNYQLLLEINCDYPCNSCSNTNTASCTQCAYDRITLPQCVCPPKKYDDGTNAQCQNCPSQCVTCALQSNSVQCLTCAVNRDTAPTCNCSAGYYDDTSVCKLCAIQCSTCTISSTNCLTCYIGRINAPTCGCAGGTFDDGINAPCLQCSYKCSTCNTSSTNCTSCPPKRLSIPKCDCQDASYDDGFNTTCQMCSYKCGTCAKTSTNCLTCSDPSRTTSSCDCPPGSTDVNDQPICKINQCDYKCASCGSDPSVCLKCSSNRQGIDCACPSGYIDDGKNSTCVDCGMQSPVARFSDQLDKIIVQFLVDVVFTSAPNRGSQSSTQNCKDFFSADTYNLFGQSPACAINGSSLIIQIGLSATVTSESSLQISPNIDSVGCNGAVYSPISVGPPLNINPPTFSVEFTPLIKSCLPNSITLTNFLNTGNRPLKSIQYSSTSKDLKDLLKQINSATSPQLTILIPPNMLLDDTVYKLSVKVTNFLNESSTQNFSITTQSSQHPFIQLIKGGPYQVFQQVVLQAQLSLTSCGGSSIQTNVSIQWVVNGVNQTIQSISPSTEQVSYMFAPHTFKVGQTINISVYAITKQGSGMDKITLVMTPSQLIVNILGGNRIQGRSQDLALQGVVIDPDEVDVNSLKNVVISWYCEKAIDGSICDLIDQNNKKVTFTDSLNQLVPAYTLVPLHAYVFYIKASKTINKTTTSVISQVTIKIDKTAQSSISVQYPARLSTQKVNLNEQLYFIVQKNIVTNQPRRILVNSQSFTNDAYLTVAINYNGQQISSFYPSTYVVPIILDQYLSGHYVVGQETVQLHFTYTDPILQGQTLESTVVLTFNISPQNGHLDVPSKQGVALSTDFLIQMDNWVDQELPLSYKFGYYTTEALYTQDLENKVQANMIILTDWSNNNYVQTILPQGTFNAQTQSYDILIVGYVQDNLGGQSVCNLTLNVIPYQIQTKRLLKDTHSQESVAIDNSQQSFNDSLTLLSSIVDQATQAKVLDTGTIQKIIQSTQQIVQLQAGGCKKKCFGNGVCNGKSQICKCDDGFYLDNCIAQKTQYLEILTVASNIITLIGTIKNSVTLQQSTEDQLMRSINILMKDKNVVKVQSSAQISSTIQNTKDGFQSNFKSFHLNGGTQTKSISTLINQVPDIAQNKRLDSITSTVDSSNDVNDKIFTATAADNKGAFSKSTDQDKLNKDLLAMSTNTTDFYANSQFTDQPAKKYKGVNMAINAQKLSKETSLQYFSTGTYLYAGELSDAELVQLAEQSMNGSGDVQMSTISYNTNPYNSDSKFPYQNQSSQMVSPNFKDSQGSTVTPSKSLAYELSTQPPLDPTNTAPNVCVTEQSGTWTDVGCTSLTYANNINIPGLGGGSSSGSSSSSSGGSSGTTSCNCEVSTKITVVQDVTGMFTGSNISALWDPSLLANFQFWNSAIFYIAIVLTLMWIVGAVWGWRKDLSDIQLEEAKEEKKLQRRQKTLKAQDELALNIDQQKPEIVNDQTEKGVKGEKDNIDEKDKRNEKQQVDQKDLDSDDENYVKQPEKKRNVGKQFRYSLPMLHEVLSIFSQYSEEEPRPVRFTIYYLKLIIMMALTSIFGQNLNTTQNVVFSLICVALMNPVVIALTKGFAPDAAKWKKIGAIMVVLITFAGSWYVCLVIAAKLGIQQSNVWTIAYTISLAVNLVVIQTITIFLQVLLTPYIKTNIDSGNLMIRILYFYLFQEDVSTIVDTI